MLVLGCGMPSFFTCNSVTPAEVVMFVDFAAGTGFSKEAHPWSLDAGKSGGPEVVGF